MKVIYLASPYHGRSEWEVWENIISAHRMSRCLWSKGFVVISPCSNTAFFGGNGIDITDSVWLEGDLEIMSRCDALFLHGLWKKSEGCIAEKKHAEELSIPTFTDIQSLIAWRDYSTGAHK